MLNTQEANAVATWLQSNTPRVVPTGYAVGIHRAGQKKMVSVKRAKH
jgi:hypothetical protein